MQRLRTLGLLRVVDQEEVPTREPLPQHAVALRDAAREAEEDAREDALDSLLAMFCMMAPQLFNSGPVSNAALPTLWGGLLNGEVHASPA